MSLNKTACNHGLYTLQKKKKKKKKTPFRLMRLTKTDWNHGLCMPQKRDFVQCGSIRLLGITICVCLKDAFSLNVAQKDSLESQSVYASKMPFR